MSFSLFFQALIVGGAPFETQYENRLALVNEIFVSLYLYSLMILFLFGQGHYPESYRDIIGIFLISIVLTSLALNIANFLWNIVSVARLEFLRWYWGRRRRQMQKVDSLPSIKESSQEEVCSSKPNDREMNDDFLPYNLD
jgi:hypothetical protein